MHQLVNNLMGNAVKYNKPGGTVSVSLKAENSGIRLTVTEYRYRDSAGVSAADF